MKHARGEVSLHTARPTTSLAFSNRYRGFVLSLLTAAMALNFVDRTIIATIGQSIKVTLKLTDTQLGLLGGLYFALLYTVVGIPIARLAERFSRVNIIALAILVWSGFTALCGTAGSFGVLAFFRFGVGLGEAGCAPPAHSLISDYFEPRQRASALGVLSFGIPLGGMIGAVAGGWLAQYFSWRVAFFAVGIPGLVGALAIKLLVKEPPRGHSEPAHTPLFNTTDDQQLLVQRPVWRSEVEEIWAVTRTLFGKFPVLHMVLGTTIASFAGYGANQFAPPYLSRTFHLGYAQVGLIFGLVIGISGGIGTIAGGVLTDRLSRWSPRWYSLVPAIGLAIAAPIYITAYTRNSWQSAASLLLLAGVFHYTYLAPTFGVVQNIVASRRRATAAAVLYFFLNIIALGGGPPFTGWMIDHFAAIDFFHPGHRSIWSSFGAMVGPQPASFHSVCPGGLGAQPADTQLMSRCSGALALATRQGMVVTLSFFVWAALHFGLGSIGLTQALAKARADRGELG